MSRVGTPGDPQRSARWSNNFIANPLIYTDILVYYSNIVPIYFILSISLIVKNKLNLIHVGKMYDLLRIESITSQ